MILGHKYKNIFNIYQTVQLLYENNCFYLNQIYLHVFDADKTLYYGFQKTHEYLQKKSHWEHLVFIKDDETNVRGDHLKPLRMMTSVEEEVVHEAGRPPRMS